MPARGGEGVRSSQIAGYGGPELDRPAADRLLAHLHAAGGHELLAAAQAQAAAEGEPHRLTDDLRRDAVTLVGDGLHGPT